MNKGYISFLLLGLALAAFLFAGTLVKFPITTQQDTTAQYTIVTPPPQKSHSSLQLGTLQFTTQSPVPTDFIFPTEPPITSPPLPSAGTYCTKEGLKTPNCQCLPSESLAMLCPAPASMVSYCAGGHVVPGPGVSLCPDKGLPLCYSLFPGVTPPACVYWSKVNPSGYALHKNDPNCVEHCIGKPVIYLYPTEPTMVNVTLAIPGSIVESIPSYPLDTGWKTILAFPDGKLLYQEKIYSELYYESSVASVNSPSTGIIIPISELSQQLTDMTTKLGLLPKEQQEFLEYWLPKLSDLHTPFIQVSLLDQKEKERVDTVTITPNPDTRIEFLVYFKGLQTLQPIHPLILPSSPLKRLGFTEVEWGGTIGY